MIDSEDSAQALLRSNRPVGENKTGFDRVVSISRAVTLLVEGTFYYFPRIDPRSNSCRFAWSICSLSKIPCDEINATIVIEAALN